MDARTDDGAIRALYQGLLDCWNDHDASGYAALFEDDGIAIGFDGSQHEGRAAIQRDLGRIFEDHPTAAYVTKVREVRFPTPQVAVLRAISGLLPPGKTELNPALNAIQMLVAVRRPDGWRIVHFQNTPAAFHGRPEEVERITEELREVARATRPW